MDKIDARIVNQLKVSSKVSSALVKTLENEDERADAIVRVRNPLHLGFWREVSTLWQAIRSYAR